MAHKVNLNGGYEQYQQPQQQVVSYQQPYPQMPQPQQPKHTEADYQILKDYMQYKRFKDMEQQLGFIQPAYIEKEDKEDDTKNSVIGFIVIVGIIILVSVGL